MVGIKYTIIIKGKKKMFLANLVEKKEIKWKEKKRKEKH